MTPADVITEVRRLINDTDSVGYRYSDATLLGYVNDALKRIALARPDLFTTLGDMANTAGTTYQVVPNYGRLLHIFQVKDGDAVTEVSRDVLDEHTPGWRTETAGPAVNWIRHERNPSAYFIYPKAPSGQLLVGEYTYSPPTYVSSVDIAMSDVYFPVLVDMTVAIVEWGDDEHNQSKRSEMFFARAMQMLGISEKTKAMIDKDDTRTPSKLS